MDVITVSNSPVSSNSKCLTCVLIVDTLIWYGSIHSKWCVFLIKETHSWSWFLYATILTYVLLPSGSFDRDDSASIPTVIPGSYSAVDSNPVVFLDFFVSIQSGMVAASGIIMLVLIIGGSFAIIDHSEAVYAGIMKLINKTKDKKVILVIAVASVFFMESPFSVGCHFDSLSI